MFNQQYNFTYNSGKKGYSVTSKTANTKTVVSYKLIVKRQTTSYTNDVKSSVRGILKLEPRTVLSKTRNAKSNVEAFAAVMYYAKPDLNIFDMYDKRLAILSNEGTDACPFWDAIYREELNKGGTFTFTVPANHEDSKFVVAENKVAFRDKDDNLRLFVIKETEEIDGNDGPLIEVYCEPEYIDELNDIVIEDKRPQNRTAKYALGQVLEDSRWEVGEVAELGTNTTNFYFMTGIEAINRILDVWGGEIRDRIEVSGNQITGRYIDILTRRGADTGKRWEIDKDIIEITRLTQSYPKTALYGRGASLETEGGGYSRLLSFEDVEWSVANGDPVDKPKGQKWVGDMDALQYYGRRMIGGRNLLRNSDFSNGSDYWKGQFTLTEEGALLQSTEGSAHYIQNSTEIPEGDYIVQIWYEVLEGQAPYLFATNGTDMSTPSTYVFDIDKNYTSFPITVKSKSRFFAIRYASGSPTNHLEGKTLIKRMKIEKGTVATDWSPAPEDVINDASYHRMGIYENGNIEDPEELLWATWNELQEQKRPFENYTLDVLLYAEKAGLDHEKVRLGDTSIALDRRFARPIEVEERIIAYEYDVANPDDTGKVELGQFRELFSDEKRLDKMQEQLDNAQGKANHPEIDDDSFPDVKPETPTNFTADPLFKIIQLKWDYDASSYIASYELYASQTPNFNPTSDRLVWRGKTGGYAFEADTDEQWYFRLRAVNTHGTASDFTSEISAQTIKINAGIDVAPYTITDQLIAQNANIDGAKIGDATITSAKIANLSASKITTGELDAEKVLVRVQNGLQSVQMDSTGFVTKDSKGIIRIHIGIRNLAGKGQSTPSTIRFFTGDGKKSAGVGMNVDDAFVVGTNASSVQTEYRSGEYAIHYAKQHRFVMRDSPNYWMLTRYKTSDGYEHPSLRPNNSGRGYIGRSSQRLWRIYVNHLHYYEQHKLSKRDAKENIRDLTPDFAKYVFDKIHLRKFNYKRDGMKNHEATQIKDSYGIILDESPNELISENGESVVQDNFVGIIAGALKYEQQRNDELDNRIQELEKVVFSNE